MAWLSLVFPLLILALVAVAIYEHVTSVTLSLPLTPALTFVTIFLPVLAAGNLLSLPYLTRKSSRSSNAFLRLISPVALQVLQGIVTTVLATLYFTDTVPTATRGCELSTRWQRLFRTKDAQAIRAIQEAFQCCGFRSVKDMAWPFPPTGVQCATRFDRVLACQGPWTAALQRSAGVELGVVLAVGVLQILSILLARQYAARFQDFSWTDLFWPRPRRDGLGGSASRPLLTGRETQTEEVDEVDEEVGETGRENGHRYGAIEGNRASGPRLEPSGLHQERNEWQDE